MESKFNSCRILYIREEAAITIVISNNVTYSFSGRCGVEITWQVIRSVEGMVAR